MEGSSSSRSQSMEEMMGDQIFRICRHEKDQNHHSSCIMTSSSPSPTSPSSSYGDYIGSESCLDALKCENPQSVLRPDQEDHSRPRGYPPPMMPWVLKRVYTNDGRLVLREDEVRGNEYFQADRSNGRLRLQLIRLNPVRLLSPRIRHVLSL